MKSILGETEEIVKAESFTDQRYYFSARLSSLQNLSESIAKVDLDKPRIKEFQTILNPISGLQKRYKTILSSPEYEEITEKATQTKTRPESKPKTPKPEPPSKNFIKNNKQDLKISSASVSAKPSSLKPSPRTGPKSNKHAKLSDRDSQNKDTSEADSNLLPIIYKQFSELVLMQWEEAADLLIDELLDDEIEFLNRAEDNQEEKRDIPSDLHGVLEELERIQDFKSGMRQKYLNK